MIVQSTKRQAVIDSQSCLLVHGNCKQVNMNVQLSSFCCKTLKCLFESLLTKFVLMVNHSWPSRKRICFEQYRTKQLTNWIACLTRTSFPITIRSKDPMCHVKIYVNSGWKVMVTEVRGQITCLLSLSFITKDWSSCLQLGTTFTLLIK